MVNSYAKRFAFTMIELIFAIVVIAISVASIPIMTGVISKGVDNNLIQEAVFAAAAQMNQVLSYRWDENSIDETIDVNGTGLARVINLDGDCNASTKLRPGHISQALHRRCLDNLVTGLSTFGKDGNESIDDIDDNIISNANLFTGAASAYGYKNTYKYSVSLSDTTVNGLQTKAVAVEIFDASNTNKLVDLKAYTFNIGEVDYHKRVYP